MALIERISATFARIEDNVLYTVRFLQEGYPGSLEPTLTLADSPVKQSIKEESDGDSPNWTLGHSKLAVRIHDDAGRLAFLASIDQQEVQIVLEDAGSNELWRGWVVPGTYGYDRKNKVITVVEAHRGMNFMRSVAYTSSAGELLSGLVSPLEIIKNALAKTGLTGKLNSAMFWAPWLTNQLNAIDDVLKNLRVDQAELRNSDGLPYVAYDVLRLMAAMWQVQIFQDGVDWYILQRKKVVASAQFKMHEHDWALSSVSQVDYDHYVDIWDANSHVIGPYTIEHTLGFRHAQQIYNHLAPSAGLIGNPGFESLLLPALSTDTGNWVPTAPNVTIARVQDNDSVGDPGGVWSLELDSHYISGAAMTDPYAEVLTTDYVDQVIDGVIEGGAGRSLQIEFSAKYNIGEGAFTSFGTGYLSIRIKIGPYFIYRDPADFNNYKLATSPPSNRDKLWFRFDPSGTFSKITINTEALDDAGTPITDVPEIRIFAPTEDYNGSGTPGAISAQFDSFKLDVIGADGTPLNEATQTAAVYKTSRNLQGTPVEVMIYGDGPTTGHKRRMRIVDGLGSLQQITGDWQFGRDFSGSASEVSHAGIWTKQRLKERAYPLMRASFRLHLKSLAQFKPWALFRDQRKMRLGASSTTGHTRITLIVDPAVSKPLQGVPIRRRMLTFGSGGNEETIQIAEIYKTAEGITPDQDEWEVILAQPTVNAHLENEPATQEIFYSFNSLELDYAESYLDVVATELVEGPDPDIECVYDVKPGTVQADAIPAADGVPCFQDISVITPGIQVLFWGEAGLGGKIFSAPAGASLPWPINPELATLAADRQFLHGYVDYDAGVIVTHEGDTSTGNNHITVRDLAGTLVGDIATYDGSPVDSLNIFVHKGQKRVYVVTDNNSASSYAIESMKYDGSDVQVHRSVSSASKAQYVSVSQDGTFMIYRHIKSGLPSEDETRKHTFSGGGEVDLIDSPLGSSGETVTAQIVDSLGLMFLFSSEDNKIITMDTSAGTEDDFATLLSSGEGMGVDDVGKFVYYPTATTGSIARKSFDELTTQTVIVAPPGPKAIKWISAG